MKKEFIEIECHPLIPNRSEFIERKIYNWLNSKAMNELIQEFASNIPNGLSVYDLSVYLLNFSEEWDYRKKQKTVYDVKTGENARWLINDEKSWSDAKKEKIINCAERLGLVNNVEPKYTKYDYFFVLGGARLSCFLRTKFALELIKQKITPKKIILLASSRPIIDSEREATNNYAPNAKTEYDLIIASMNKLFSIDKVVSKDEYIDENENKSWKICEYKINDEDFSILAISLPSSEPNIRRANSADTYEFFLNKYNVKKGSKILLLTGQIYVPYQHMEALRIIALKHNLMVETVGFPPKWSPNLQGMINPVNYLQEIRATIVSMNKFLQEYNNKNILIENKQNGII